MSALIEAIHDKQDRAALLKAAPLPRPIWSSTSIVRRIRASDNLTTAERNHLRDGRHSMAFPREKWTYWAVMKI